LKNIRANEEDNSTVRPPRPERRKGQNNRITDINTIINRTQRLIDDSNAVLDKSIKEKEEITQNQNCNKIARGFQSLKRNIDIHDCDYNTRNKLQRQSDCLSIHTVGSKISLDRTVQKTKARLKSPIRIKLKVNRSENRSEDFRYRGDPMSAMGSIARTEGGVGVRGPVQNGRET